MENKYYFKDFTEESYQRLLKNAKINYNFICYGEYNKSGKNIILRHDIDFSVHRAYKLAILEAQQNIRATYFVSLHSDYYNLFEKEIVELIAKIIAMGHEIGLHFDPVFYDHVSGNLTKYLTWEKTILEKLFKQPIYVFSIHNPDVGHWLDVNKKKIGGMLNAYSACFKENYHYCSDSNGYWRFERIGDVFKEAKEIKLHILIHPEWWTPRAISPRQRIFRCIDGRARKQRTRYRALLKNWGRKDIA